MKLEIVRKKERKKETSVKYICESTHSVYPYLFTTMYTVYAILARDTRLYEKVFRADERATLGKIFRSRHHVARFPNLENHVQPTCPFGRVLVPQHPITLNSNFVLSSTTPLFPRNRHVCYFFRQVYRIQ